VSTKKLLTPICDGHDSIREDFHRHIIGQGSFKKEDLKTLADGSYENEEMRRHWMTWKSAIWRRSWFPRPQLVAFTGMAG